MSRQSRPVIHGTLLACRVSAGSGRLPLAGKWCWRWWPGGHSSAVFAVRLVITDGAAESTCPACSPCSACHPGQHRRVVALLTVWVAGRRVKTHGAIMTTQGPSPSARCCDGPQYAGSGFGIMHTSLGGLFHGTYQNSSPSRVPSPPSWLCRPACRGPRRHGLTTRHTVFLRVRSRCGWPVDRAERPITTPLACPTPTCAQAPGSHWPEESPASRPGHVPRDGV